MTREETKKCIEVMQAYVDGKEIEVKNPDNEKDNWQITRNPVWSWARLNYRIKPQPMKVTEEEKKILSKSAIFWAKHKKTGEISSYWRHAIETAKKDHYILNPDTMEWEDWSEK